MDHLKATLLGVLQGLTEFLPISSSGHLIAGKTVLGYQAPLVFDVLLHLPTLLAVLLYFRRDLLRLAASPERWAVLLRVALGTVPAAGLARLFKSYRQEISPWIVVLGWTLSGCYLLLSRGRQGPLSQPQLPLWRAFVVGGTQGIAAILPGISRSGASIASGLWLGLQRMEACRFSFNLAIPLMLGAVLVESMELLELGEAGQVHLPGGWTALLLAMAAAFLVGLVAIHVVLKTVAGNHFHRFGWYNLAAAASFAIYLAAR